MEIVHWPDTRQAPAPALVAFHRVQVACQRHVAPAEPIRTEDEEVGWFRHPPGEDTRSLWIAMDGAGDPVGGAWLSGAAGAAANADLLVSPGQRQTGVGGRLLSAVRDAAQAAGTVTVFGMCADPDSRRFLESRGTVAGRSLLRQVLRLTDLPPRPPLPPADGVEVLNWTGATPDELLVSYAEARNAINDAPSDEAEHEFWTPGRVRELERAIAGRGARLHVTVLLRGDAVVGFSELRVAAASGAVASTEDTAMIAAERGRGLGRRLKVASLAALRAARPDVSMITTTNESTNASMLAINRSVGFVPVVTRTRMRLDL